MKRKVIVGAICAVWLLFMVGAITFQRRTTTAWTLPDYPAPTNRMGTSGI